MTAIGLDFGTTNTSAAIFDGRQVHLLPIDPANAEPTVMRTALFISRDGVPCVGREAIDRYSEGNVGREIDYQWQFIGRTEVTFADVGTVMQALYTMVDRNTPGRLFQSLKSHLSDAAFQDTDIFGTRYTLEALIGLILAVIARRVEEVTGQRPQHLVIGRPVHYATEARLDALAIDRMRQACQVADLPTVDFLPEPTAAALAYALTNPGQQYALVFDFGGGTLDVTVLRIEANGQVVVLATDGVPVGGDLLDRRVVLGRLVHHFGAGATLGPRRLPFPATILGHLSEWQSIVELNLPRYWKIIDEAVRTGDRPRELRALATLVRENYGLPLFEVVERAKVRLSTRQTAEISMNVPGIQFDDLVERWEFEGLIGPDLRTVEACIDRALATADLRPTDIQTVLRTGGSSRVPAFVEMLAAKFGEESLREIDLFTSVAAGLAIAARDPSLLTRVQQPTH